MKVIVYLEGTSDKLSMEQLLYPLINNANQKGTIISFIALSPEKGRGNSKRELITKIPKKAVNILLNDPDAHVCIIPDLYPKNTGGAHEIFAELKQIILNNFKESLAIKNISDIRINNRFHAFCFKYDLEALILAAEEQLASRLKKKSINCIWQKPVEDQDHNTPPKRIVEQIFIDHDEYYHGTIDAPIILGNANYNIIAERCPQCFKPFVDFLESIIC